MQDRWLDIHGFLHLLMVGSGTHQAGKSKEELASVKAEQARLSEEADAARRDAKDLRSQLSEALSGGDSLRGELDALNLKVVSFRKRQDQSGPTTLKNPAAH